MNRATTAFLAAGVLFALSVLIYVAFSDPTRSVTAIAEPDEKLSAVSSETNEKADGSVSGIGLITMLAQQAMSSDKPKKQIEQSKPEKQLRKAELDLSKINGYDWLAMSTKEKLELCLVIEERIGQHDMVAYRDFIQTFYQNASDSNSSELLKKTVSEIAAIAAVMDFTEDFSE